MKAILVLLFAFGCIISVADAQVSEKLLISVKLDQGETQSITGLITNEKHEPVADVSVYITTTLGTVIVKSSLNGSFVYTIPDFSLEEKLNVSIKAQKDGYLTGYTNTSFFVKNKPSLNENKKLDSDFKILTADKIKDDPIAFKILQNIEQNKQQEEKRQKRLQEIDEYQRYLEEQRQIADQNLLNDLGVWFEQFDPFRPRNAFSSFVSQMDATVQDIYWAQFNFTETKTKEGLAALQTVLDSGGSPQDARRAFYDNAATQRSDLLNLNNVFNLNYGVEQNNTQTKPNSDE
ncbi:MAG: hypothetical protein ACT4NT_03390 [Nitrososphaerota archaeon]